MNIIGIAGAKRVGKDTFYHVLKARGYSVSHLGFSDPIEADLAEVKGLQGATKEQRRQLVADYANLARELQGRSYWIDRLSRVVGHCRDTEALIITGLRFAEDASWVKDMDGTVVTVKRPGAASGSHDTEQHWHEIEPDYTIENNQGLSHYAQEVVRVYKEILSDGVKLSDVVTARGGYALDHVKAAVLKPEDVEEAA